MNANVRSIDERYFEWLYDLVADPRERNPARSFFQLMEILFLTPFEYYVPNDDCRAEDGRNLRIDFMHDRDLLRDQEWWEIDCSMLEMLIALSRRLEFQSRMSADWWFWKLLSHVGIDKYHDEQINDGIADAIRGVLEVINSRTYGRSGRGGLFPVRHSSRDQRDYDLWYQMSIYLAEHEDLLY